MKTLRNLLFTGMIGLAALGLSGCETITPTMTMQKESQELNQEPQYSVRRIDIFEDDLAYNNKRGIYEITDNKNKKKYLGVSGIGITELGYIRVGRVAADVER